MRSDVERKLLELLRDIECHTYNTISDLGSGDNINIDYFTDEVACLLDSIRDYKDQYQVLMNQRKLINLEV